jgi:hypothetical protein
MARDNLIGRFTLIAALACVFGCNNGDDDSSLLDTDGGAYSDGDSDSDTDADSDMDSDVDSDTDSDTDTDPDAGADSGADTDTDTDTDAEAIPMDLNGDGESDLVLGRFEQGNNDVVRVFYGGGDLAGKGPDDADAVIAPSSDPGYFGIVINTCDLNDDGKEDLLIGDGQQAYVYFGGTDPSAWSDGDLIIAGADNMAYYDGMRCADVTGDGIPDAVVSGYADNSRVWIVPGGDWLSQLDGDVDVENTEGIISISGITVMSDNVGYAIEIGDFNGDEIFDILASSPNYWDPSDTTYRGMAFIFLGGETLESCTTDDADAYMVGAPDSWGFGLTVAAGDMDGDGIDDCILTDADRLIFYQGSTEIGEETRKPSAGELGIGYETSLGGVSGFSIRYQGSGMYGLQLIVGADMSTPQKQVVGSFKGPFGDKQTLCGEAYDMTADTEYATAISASIRGSIFFPEHGPYDFLFNHSSYSNTEVLDDILYGAVVDEESCADVTGVQEITDNDFTGISIETLMSGADLFNSAGFSFYF